MHEALVNNKTYTIEGYLAEFGRLSTKNGAMNQVNNPIPVCPDCKKDMTLRATHRSNRDSHFAHIRNSGPCPSKNAAAAPYKYLKPTKPDLIHAKEICHFIRDHWCLVFQAMNKRIPKLTSQEFLVILKRATQHNVWAYTGLDIDELPSLLSTILDFPDGKDRKYWLRFWYSSPIRHLEQLWINPGQRGVLYRSSYFHPITVRRPRKQHVCRSKPIAFSPIRLTSKCLKPYESDLIDNWIKKHPAFS